MGWGEPQGPEPDSLLGVLTAEYHCPLPGCTYSYEGQPGPDTEAALQAHLDSEHVGWTMAELRRHSHGWPGTGPLRRRV